MNRPICIDFAPRSFMRALRLTRPLTWVIGLSGLLLCAGVSFQALHIVQEQRAAEARLQMKQAEFAARIAHKPIARKSSVTEARAGAVNAAIGQLNLPWQEVFNAIEAATPATIALLALEPDAKRHVLKGVAEAKASDEMIGYLEALRQQDFFSELALTRHEINEQDPNKPIRFQFEANWIEPAQ
jgi:Tfp pilus assembly protein PilN